MFCPNPSCPCHNIDKINYHSLVNIFLNANIRINPCKAIKMIWFQKFGYYFSKKYNQKIQRFRCRFCNTTFTQNTLNINHYDHNKYNYKLVAKLNSESVSIRGIARLTGYGLSTIVRIIDKLSRNACAINHIINKQIELNEPLVADGLESYTKSRYFNENINILVGKKSQFIYYFNHVTFRRKGRVTEKQKKKMRIIEQKYKFEKNGFSKKNKLLINKVYQLINKNYSPVFFYSDESTHIKNAIKKNKNIQNLINANKFCHYTVSSKIPRNLQNDLFPVNYIDNELKKDLSSERRKTSCFAKDINNKIARVNIYCFNHNFFKNYRIGNKQFINTKHYMKIQIKLKKSYLQKLLKNYYKKRFFLSHFHFTQDEKMIWLKKIYSPFSQKSKYLPKYILA